MQDKLHIIIAEDDIDDAEIIQDSFEKHSGFVKVDLVQNGKELLEYLKSGKKPDVILTDINMPILSGFEAIKEIRDISELANIPAFVYSTTINPTYESQGRALGINGFLIKPFRIDEFDQIPDKILSILQVS
jgi:CheY-like chemotaxis protein